MRLLGFLVILGAAGFLLYRYVITPSETRSCEKLAALCGEKTAAIASCVKDVKELGKSSKEAVARFETCVTDAKSCGEGAGCLVGAGLGAASNMFNDFMKGVGKAFDK